MTGLEECSKDNLEFLKDKAIKAMFDLLRSKPEQVTPVIVTLLSLSHCHALTLIRKHAREAQKAQLGMYSGN